MNVAKFGIKKMNFKCVFIILQNYLKKMMNEAKNDYCFECIKNKEPDELISLQKVSLAALHACVILDTHTHPPTPNPEPSTPINACSVMP